MNTRATPALGALGLALALLSAAPAMAASLDGGVTRIGSAISVEKTLIDKSTVDAVEQLLRETPGVTALRLTDIPGGVYGQSRRLSKLIANLDAIVRGDCLSSCATVALAARSLSLVPNAAPRPTRLMVHGTFRTDIDRWSDYGLRHMGNIAGRLPAVGLEAVARALTFPTANAGLLIVADTPNPAAGKPSVAYVCEQYPSKCESLEIGSLDRLGIALARQE